MRRVLLSILVVISIVLFVVVAAAWVRSYWTMDQLMIRPTTSKQTIHLFWARGSVACTVTTDVDYQVAPHWYKVQVHLQPQDLYRYWSSGGVADRNLLYFGGFVVERPRKASGRALGILVPHWFLLILTALVPALAIWRRAHGRKRDPNLCATCGYDLRASTERCPECVTPIAAPSRP
jgi:hypothetical protein